MTGVFTAILIAATKKSSGSSTFIIFLLLIAVVGYFLLLRPQQQKAKRQRAQQSNIAVGDEVQTVGGIVGHVVDMDNDRVTIVTGHQTATPTDPSGAQPHRIHLVRQAIARKIEPMIDTPAEDTDTDEADDEEISSYDHDFGSYDADSDADADETSGEHGDHPTGDGRAAGSGGTGP